MVLNVAVTEYRAIIPSQVVGLARDSHTVRRLRAQYAPLWFTSPIKSTWNPDLNAGRGFQHCVDKYAEVTLKAPWDDVLLYYDWLFLLSGKSIQPGTLHYPPLYPVLNTSAMSNAAEALAGWFCEDHYSWTLTIRPERVTPALIFRDRVNRRWALIEVKSSGKLGELNRKLTSAMIKLLPILSSTNQLNPNPYYVGVIMVQVKGPADLLLTSLILEES